MNRKTKSEIRNLTIKHYKAFAPEIYKRYSSQYSTTEIRLEILKALQSHIMQRTSDTLRCKLRRKKERRIQNAPIVIEEQLKDWQKKEVKFIKELSRN